MTSRVQPAGGAVFLAAVRRGDEPVVSSMLAEQPALCQNVDSFGKSALHYARLMGHAPVVNMLEGRVASSNLQRYGRP